MCRGTNVAIKAEERRVFNRLFSVVFRRLIDSVLANGSATKQVSSELIPATKTLVTQTHSFPLSPLGLQSGRLFAQRYKIGQLVGRGGTAEVYLAEDLLLGERVALKFCASGLARNCFRNEVRVSREISHVNVRRVHDIGEAEGVTYLSMEYVDGENLASLLHRTGKLSKDKAIDIGRQICNGLAAAHRKGVVHRDLKPANVIVDTRGRARITDFGLAGVCGQIRDMCSGTPGYMSPEQIAGREVSIRSDIYALGVVLHELLTGERPPRCDSELDPALKRVIRRCLSEDPQMRPGTALIVARALRSKSAK